MTLSLSTALALAAQCAPAVAPQTLLSVAHTESRFNPLAIGVNGGRAAPPVRNAAQAARTARRYIAAGYSVDLGIAQINSANLGWLGLTIDDAFDPCRNLAAASRILTANYTHAARRYTSDTALGVALSMYNTGTANRGYRNGYVARVYRAAATLVPAIGDAPQTPYSMADTAMPSRGPVNRNPAEITARPTPPAWDVFAAAGAASVMVFKGVEQ